MATLVEIDTEDGGTAIAFLGRIYKISAPGCAKVYVGSTKRELNVRMTEHKGAKHEYDKGNNTYYSSHEILAYECATIELLEEDAYISMQHMRDREAFWIQRLPSVNKSTPGRSQRESERLYKKSKKECSKCGRHVRIDGMKTHRTSKRCVQTRSKTIPSS